MHRYDLPRGRWRESRWTAAGVGLICFAWFAFTGAPALAQSPPTGVASSEASDSAVVYSADEPSQADPAESDAATRRARPIHPVDWCVLAAYALAMLGVGWWRREKPSEPQTAETYFLGGGAMRPWLVGVSLFATLLSTITYLAAPGEVCGKGPLGMTRLFALPIAYVLVSYWLLPLLMRRRVTSAYALLEERLGLPARWLGALMFITLRLVWMTLLVSKTAEALTAMLGIEDAWTPWIVGLTSAVAVGYTTLGGLRAVVITDFLQTLMLLGGALLVLVLVTIDFGGLGWFPTTWQPHWDDQPIASWDPSERVTVLGSIVEMSVWLVATLIGDQVSVQRFMATADGTAARRALTTQFIVTLIVNVVLTLVGLALMSYFLKRPEELGAGATLAEHGDQAFPIFIARRLPIGVTGLVLSGLFAAAMSSVDSGVNSITAVVQTDFLERLGVAPSSTRGRARLSQALALVIGVTLVAGASRIDAVPGNLFAVTQKTSNLLTVPIFSLFLIALFRRGIAPWRAIVATLASVAAAAVVAFSGSLVSWLCAALDWAPESLNSAYVGGGEIDSISGFPAVADPISFQWIGPAALAAAILVAWPRWPRRRA